jgi:hypothetical protein
VAGTLWYRLNVEHVYQRRFGDSESLAEALAASHWYIISRRPTVRIIADTVRLDDQILTVDFITRDNLTSPEQVYAFGSDFRQLGFPHDFRTYSDGAYFSVAVGDKLIHGDAWALASLLSAASRDIARQEVLYIGQAFGPGGTGNAWERTQRVRGQVRRHRGSFPVPGRLRLAPPDQELPARADVLLVQAADHVRIHLAG